jgi:hypothetical protein
MRTKEGGTMMVFGKKRFVSRSFFILVLIFLATLSGKGQVFSAALTEDEKNNVGVYEKVADGVVNVTSTAMQLDFFFNAFPTQGSGQAPSLIQKAIF